MGSHSVTCQPTEANMPRLTPAMQAGTRFTYPERMEGHSVCLFILLLWYEIVHNLYICLTRDFRCVIGILLHSISSADVTAVRNQSAMDTESCDLDMSRDYYHRRRRDRVIGELDQPEADIEINQPDNVSNQTTPNSTHKQEVTNRNAETIFDPAHDLDMTSQSSDQTSVLSTVSEDSQSVNTMTSEDDESYRKSKSNLFPSWLRRLKQFRVTSSKRVIPMNLVSYSSTDDVQRSHDNKFVSRHESMTSPTDEKPSAIRVTSRDQSDAAVTSQGRGLFRHSSDLSLAKSRRNDEKPYIFTRPVTSRPISHGNSGSVSTLSRPPSVGTGHDLVRHESLSRLEPPNSHGLARYHSQPLIVRPGIGSAASSPSYQISKPRRSNIVPAMPQRDNLGPTAAMSRHDNATSPLRQYLLPDRGKLGYDWQPVRMKSTLQREVTSGGYKTRSGQDIMEPHNIHLTSRQITPPNNNGRPRDDVAMTTESPRRHNPMTSRVTGQVVTRTSPTSNVQQPSPSTNKGRTTSGGHATSGDQTTSGRHLAKSADQSRQPSTPQASSTSLDTLHDVRRKPPSTINKPHKPVSPITGQNLTQIPPPPPPPSPSDSFQSSSSSNQDHTRRKPPQTMNKPQKHLSPVTVQNLNQIPPPSPSESLQSSSSSTQERARRKPASISKLSSQKPDQTNVTTYPVPSPRRKASNTQAGSPQSFQTAASNNQQNVRRNPTSTTSKLLPQKPLQNTTNTSTTYPVPSQRQKASHVSSGSPQTSSSENPYQITGTTTSRDLSRSDISPTTGRSQIKSKSERPVSASKETLGHTPASPMQSSLSKSREKVDPRSATSARSSTVERNPVMNSVAIPHQTSSSVQSESVHRGSLFNHSNVDITSTSQETPLAKAPEFQYSEPPYPRGVQEAPADDPDVLDKQSKTRSSQETVITEPKATKMELPSNRDSEHDADDVSESRSRRETANIVVVRPLPTSDQVTRGKENNMKKKRARRKTIEIMPNGSDDKEDMDMRSRRSSVSDVANGKKSALRKSSRSQSRDRHVSYSNTDTVYRSLSPLFTSNSSVVDEVYKRKRNLKLK